MKNLELDGMGDPVLVRTNQRLLEVLVDQGARMQMACGGKGLCATCHVHVTAGAERLSPVTPRERRSLEMLVDRRPSSRLACQAKVLESGVRVALPTGRYLTASADLEGLVGRRAEEPVLHPIDGRVLIATGKIITRSRIRELVEVDYDVAEMRTRSLTLRR
ncbi:MAG: 2Fe-2S iron-sulfur cluster binding domain-containing protein [Myxococcales bacterium]|nr:2Fe-2S iron-sulfur cluster binding domain-containing protein [Myxococcales bacterium]